MAFGVNLLGNALTISYSKGFCFFILVFSLALPGWMLLVAPFFSPLITYFDDSSSLAPTLIYFFENTAAFFLSLSLSLPHFLLIRFVCSVWEWYMDDNYRQFHVFVPRYSFIFMKVVFFFGHSVNENKWISIIFHKILLGYTAICRVGSAFIGRIQISGLSIGYALTSSFSHLQNTIKFIRKKIRKGKKF